ncbi:TlpA family protein disulfide reductase [Bacillus sp. SB49]|uniref:TlpA family protein disulfide reductase n=1 Tax=Bacillaceae TaxID=186817 RepID=UPI000415265B|nr:MULTISPECIES: TlpA disulfide reductase family protein [Bacillaceae]QHT47544.1 TlpA family protein disulfide reductase [Bacillus sp. SB49]
MKQKAPDFELPFINKQGTYQLREDKGKAVVLTFWASWCPDCGRDLPLKEQLYQNADKEKVKMLTINVTGRERSPEAGIAYTKEFLTQPTLADKDRTVYDLFGCRGVPSTVIIDQNGFIHEAFGDQASFLDIAQSLGRII